MMDGLIGLHNSVIRWNIDFRKQIINVEESLEWFYYIVLELSRITICGACVFLLLI